MAKARAQLLQTLSMTLPLALPLSGPLSSVSEKSLRESWVLPPSFPHTFPLLPTWLIPHILQAFIYSNTFSVRLSWKPQLKLQWPPHFLSFPCFIFLHTRCHPQHIVFYNLDLSFRFTTPYQNVSSWGQRFCLWLFFFLLVSPVHRVVFGTS